MRVKLQFALAVTALAILGFLIVGFVTPGASARQSRAAWAIATTIVPDGSTSTTVAELVLPDASITPGALNPRVRQATLAKTICKRGWTRTIRPPVAYTNALKRRQMIMYGETGSLSEYEEDHFIPLELGGAPRSPKNLWPEPRSESRRSDPLETKLKRQVCKAMLSLKAARAAIRAFKKTQG